MSNNKEKSEEYTLFAYIREQNQFCRLVNDLV